MNKLISIVLILGMLNISFADDAVSIEKDQKAPFTGILLTPEKARDLKNTVIERDGLVKLNDSLKKSMDLQVDIINKNQDKVTILMNQNDNLAKNLYSERSTSDLTKFLLFGAGVLTTVLVMYGVQKVK